MHIREDLKSKSTNSLADMQVRSLLLFDSELRTGKVGKVGKVGKCERASDLDQPSYKGLCRAAFAQKG